MRWEFLTNSNTNSYCDRSHLTVYQNISNGRLIQTCTVAKPKRCCLTENINRENKMTQVPSKNIYSCEKHHSISLWRDPHLLMTSRSILYLALIASTPRRYFHACGWWWGNQNLARQLGEQCTGPSKASPTGSWWRPEMLNGCPLHLLWPCFLWVLLD
jgi:hypothetical protein